MTEYDPQRLDADELSATQVIAKEREQLERAIAERQRQIDKANTLAWTHERNAARDCSGTKPWIKEGDVDCTPITNGTTVTRSMPNQRAQPMSNDMSAEWRAYIEARDRSWVTAQAAAVGEVIAEERKRVAEEHAKMRAEFERELLQIRNEFLQIQLDEARGVKRPLRVVQPVQTDSMVG